MLEFFKFKLVSCTAFFSHKERRDKNIRNTILQLLSHQCIYRLQETNTSLCKTSELNSCKYRINRADMAMNNEQVIVHVGPNSKKKKTFWESRPTKLFFLNSLTVHPCKLEYWLGSGLSVNIYSPINGLGNHYASSNGVIENFFHVDRNKLSSSTTARWQVQ